MRVVRNFILEVVKKNSVGERSQRHHFNSSEVKQCSKRSQRFDFNSSEVKDFILIVVK